MSNQKDTYPLPFVTPPTDSHHFRTLKSSHHSFPSNELLPHRLSQRFHVSYTSWGVSFYQIPFWNTNEPDNEPGFLSRYLVGLSQLQVHLSQLRTQGLFQGAATTGDLCLQSPTGVIAVDGSQEKAP